LTAQTIIYDLASITSLKCQEADPNPVAPKIDFYDPDDSTISSTTFLISKDQKPRFQEAYMYIDDIKHKQDLISEHKRRLSVLERNAAQAGRNANPDIVIEIEDIRIAIATLIKEVAILEMDDNMKTSYSVARLPLPLQKHDDFFKQLGDGLEALDRDPSSFRSGVLACLERIFHAEHVFVAKYTSEKWDIFGWNASETTEIQSLIGQGAHLREMLLQSLKSSDQGDLIDHNKQANVNIGSLLNGEKKCLFVSFVGVDVPGTLVIYGIGSDIEPDTSIASALNALLQITKNLTITQKPEDIQIAIYNNLKRQFGYVSDFVYEKQFSLFEQRLRKMITFFEPVVSLSYVPYICRWEALARDPETGKTPVDLFKTAELWGHRFLMTLDIHFLRAAVTGYKDYPKDKKTRTQSQSVTVGESHSPRIGDLLPLSVNVYPDSLVRHSYRQSIVDIAKDRIFPLDKLTLEISEKSPLPIPNRLEEQQDEVDWFREQLKYYTSQGITLAIDDFGIGYASTSRLSRLEPAIVKIDRDALLHNLGSHTIQYVLRLQRESMGKMQVIVEGYDDESKITLSELYILGIRYVQTWALGEAKRYTYRLTIPEQEDILRKLKIP
jgi:EAL domain-containing protein (putative c-di-GMP-specific phosphodiesterase class I)